MGARSIKEVLEHHVYHNQRGNLEEVLNDYCDDSVILTQDGKICGLEQIRAFFTESMTKVFPPNSVWENLCMQIEGKMAYIVWQAESDFFKGELGTDTFMIENGYIMLQSFAGVINKKDSV